MATELVSPPPGGVENQIMTKTSSADGAMVWRAIFQPRELWVKLVGTENWYGGLSTAPSFYVSYVYQTGACQMYMTGANTQVDRIGSSQGYSASSGDYFYVLFNYGGTAPGSTTRVPVVVKLDYQGRVQPVNGQYPIPVSSTTNSKSYLYGGQIIAKAPSY